MKNYSPPKYWMYAKTKLGKREAMQNSNIEGCYHRIIYTVKKLYMKPNEVYFERDYKTDKSEGLLNMHSFITATYCWTLDCELDFKYAITFAFGDCPFESEVRKLLRVYPLSENTTEVNLEPTVKAFYNRVLAYQDKRFHHVLNV